ncbi:adenylate kinase [Allorhodopirellula solitaria]|uniref:Adenylate kinase n=1 Tax=Allorhodopirellula solitaria TaxID=2527987 RepID=A0A5C5YGA6_9BACT|nr:adenylate kinase [Allorhodopirellula solitaria]TWT73923.1 adenylate kinase [Allorhodopirellula solitaria]
MVFIGPPGSGKGTQCERLSNHFGVPHISTGEMLRSLDSETGHAIHSSIDRGHFAPDDFIMQMIAQRLLADDCQRGYLLDGFPRTLVQAQAFDAILHQCSQQLDHVIHLVVDVAELVQRLTKRSQCGHRSDDSPEFIHERFELYEERTAPLLAHYEQQSLVRSVDGMRSEDAVFATINQFSC